MDVYAGYIFLRLVVISLSLVGPTVNKPDGIKQDGSDVIYCSRHHTSI